MVLPSNFSLCQYICILRSSETCCTHIFMLVTLGCAADRMDLVSKQVAESLGGKGGGRSGRYQGKAEQITQAQVQEAMQRMTASIAVAQQQ